MLESEIRSGKIKDEPVKWRRLQKCARVYDDEHVCNVSLDHEMSSSEDLIINVSAKRGKDIALQCDSLVPYVRSNQDQQYPQSSAPTVPAQPYQSPQFYQGNRQPNGYFFPPPTGPNAFCSFCRRVGHEQQNCRARLKQCFVCGAPDHFIQNCPNNRRMSARSSSQPPAPRPSQPFKWQ